MRTPLGHSGPRARVRAAGSPVWVLLAAALAAPAAGVAQETHARATAVAALERDLAGVVRRVQRRGATWAVLVTSLDRGDTLFALNADSALAPASNVKLLTTAAALATLGPDYRYRTYLLGTGPVRDGVLHGDLILYGTGDAGLSDRFHARKDAVFRILTEQLLAAGVHTVAGDLVADASYLEGPERMPTWNEEDLNDHFAAPVSALSFNENVASLRVVPAHRPGMPPEVHTVPPVTDLLIENHALTVASRPRPRLAILRHHPTAPVRVEGRIRAGSRDVWRQMTAASPPAFAVRAFQAVLDEEGIQVRGRVRVVRDASSSAVRRVSAPRLRPDGRVRVLARYTSPPLREYLRVVNHESHNLFAELIVRTVGRVRTGDGHPSSATRAVLDILGEMGVPLERVTLLDGSGLSPGNRVSPATLVALLREVSQTPMWPEFWASLPEAGRRRGLGRMYRSAAAGNLRAKTGTIDRVSALTGVVRSRDGERLAFSILSNGVRSRSAAKAAENRIGVRLAEFSRGDAKLAFQPVPDPEPPAVEESRYRIRRGDNLTVVARRLGVRVEELLQANPGLDPDRIYAGQWIQVPARAGGG